MNRQGPNSSPTIRFDVFELDFKTRVLRRKGRPIKLQEQPFRILALIVARPGDVVSREELRQLLWPADTFVDFDHGLNSAVARLRDALKDSAGKPRLIETVAKKGYRFIGSIDDSPPRELPPATIATKMPDGFVAARSSGKLSIAVMAISVLLCLLGLVAFYRNGENARASTVGEGKWRSIASCGDEVVYQEEMAKLDIWRVDLKSARHLQKAPVSWVSEKGNKMRPDVSPDGKKIAFESDRRRASRRR